MAKAKDISQAVREVCLWFPESEEVISHGSPDFRVRQNIRDVCDQPSR
jgi:hypothetical protein